MLRSLENKRYALAPEILLTPDGPAHDLVILIDKGVIADLSPRNNFVQTHPEMDIVDLEHHAIIPGFIDAHVHLGQGFGKALACGEPSQIWQRIWIPLEGNLDPETTYICAKWMLLEALRGGFTAVNNFAIINREKTEAIHQASVETGVKVVSSTGAVNKAAYDNVTKNKAEFKQIDEALKRAEDHMALCKKESKITPSLCVSGVQGASKELIHELSGFCRKSGALFQIHANEHIPEVHSSVIEHGRRPTEYIADCNGLGEHTILHHVTLVTESEIELIRSTNTGLSYNPVASVWKGDAVCPALTYLERNVRVGLGTDSTRSDSFRLLEAAEACQRIEFGMRVNDFSSGAGWRWVDCASRGSADVCGLGQTTGKLEKGFSADFLIVDMDHPEVLPSWDFVWELVRFYNRDQIKAVVIDGDLVMQNGKATGWDHEQFIREQLPRAVETVKTAPIIRRHGPSMEHGAKTR